MTAAARCTNVDLPPVSAWRQSGFQRYVPKYLTRHFSLLGLDRQGFDPASCSMGHRTSDNTGRATLVYANHPGWFDPLVAHYLTQHLFPGQQFYAPIDALALEQYQVLGKLGFYGIDLQSRAGAARFLRTSQRILASPASALWMTPEGRFCDPRDHDRPLQPGLAHLCQRAAMASPDAGKHPSPTRERGTGPTREHRTADSSSQHESPSGHLPRILPMAIEYAFWDERLPVCLVRFGDPLAPPEKANWDKATWEARLRLELRATQQQLAQNVIARDPDTFVPLLSSRRGAGGIYDWMRRLKCWATGRRFQAEHRRRSP